MGKLDLDFKIPKLGECRFLSPMAGGRFVRDEEHSLVDSNLHDIKKFLDEGKGPPTMELAGPREKIYFEPSNLKCGIVTCGGICPGLNDVIRSIVMSLFHHYGV